MNIYTNILGHLTKMADTSLFWKKKFQKSSSPEPVDGLHCNLVCSSGMLAYQSLYKLRPWIHLDRFYADVKFGRLCF